MHRTTIVIPDELLRQLRRCAADQVSSVAAVMREALEEKVRSYYRQALMAECRALEQRWAVVHEEALHLDQEWQRLLSMFISRVEAQRSGQPPSWTDGALMFYDLDKHTARTSSLAHEALQMCRQYTLALQRALDTMAEG
jgi:predicted transcriptional regulator